MSDVDDEQDRSLLSQASIALLRGTRALVALLQRRARLPLVREVLSHWVRERRAIRQGLVALAICITVTLVAGVVLGAMEQLLDRLPGLLILVPSAIGMRGAIFAALGARLGTGMLTGQFELVARRRSFTGQNVEAAALLSVVTAAASAVIARAAAGLLGLETIDVLSLVVVSMTGALLSSVVVLAVVLVLARSAVRRSWDMDAVGTPIISATADISTLPALIVGTLLLEPPLLGDALGAVAVVAALVAAVAGTRNGGELTRTVVRESLPVLGYAAVMGVLAGTVLQARLDTLVTDPALLVAIPPFIASCGAIGGILSARLASAFHLGLVDPRPVPQRAALLEGSLTLLFGLVGFATVGLLTQVASSVASFSSPGVGRLAGITVTGGLLAVGLLFAVAYYAATASVRFGLDPDNVSIPVVTATMDLFGILCLVAGIAVFGGS